MARVAHHGAVLVDLVRATVLVHPDDGGGVAVEFDGGGIGVDASPEERKVRCAT